MRGIAALIVLFSHFRNMFYPNITLDSGASAFLYPLVAAHESVMFFFLLSGFVLTLPFQRGNRQPYPIFLWRRILRIYSPYLGALALAVAGCALWHNRLGTTGWAAITWFAPVDLRSVAEHVLFLGNYDYARYNPAFWSLVYEMRISIIFPLLFLAVDKLRTRYTLGLVAACTFLGVAAYDSKTLITFEYAGIFLVGVLMAKHRSTLGQTYRALAPGQRVLLLVLAVLFYNEGHRITKFGPLWHLGDMPIVLGAAGFIIVGLNSSTVSRILNSAAAAFLGRISYSLYLVHGTVLFAMAAMLKDKVSGPVFLLAFLPAAILLSWGFYVAVEAPFMNMSRNVGRKNALPAALPAEVNK